MKTHVLHGTVELGFVKRPVLSVVLPAHNEATIISDVVKSYYKEICSKMPSRLFVAEDGSTNGTREILNALKDEIPMVLLSNHKRKGYAKAVADALKVCNTDWIFFSDSDCQYFPSDFWRFWKRRYGYDMIIGCKVKRHEGFHRFVLAKGFHLLVNSLFNLNLHDMDCGYRLIRREVIDEVLNEVRFLKYSFWAEFTIRAYLKGFKILEVPIRHGRRMHGDTRIYKISKIPMIVLKQLIGLAQLYVDLKK